MTFFLDFPQIFLEIFAPKKGAELEVRFGLRFASDHGVGCAPPSSAGSLRQSAAWPFRKKWNGKTWWEKMVEICCENWKKWKKYEKKRNIWKKWSNFGEVGVFHKSLKLKFLQADFVTKKSTSFCQTLQGRLIWVDFCPTWLYRILPNPWQHLLGCYYSSELWSTGCYNVLQRIHKSCSIVWTVCCSLMQIGGEMAKDLKTSKRLWGFALLKLRSTAFVVQMLAIWLRENETFCGWNWCKSCWGALPCRHGVIEGYFMFCCHVLQHTNI